LRCHVSTRKWRNAKNVDKSLMSRKKNKKMTEINNQFASEGVSKSKFIQVDGDDGPEKIEDRYGVTRDEIDKNKPKKGDEKDVDEIKQGRETFLKVFD